MHLANLHAGTRDEAEVENCLQISKEKTQTEVTQLVDNQLDIKANGLFDWRIEKFVFDVKVINLFARHCPKNIPNSYKYLETLKKLKNEPILVEVEKITCPSTEAPFADSVASVHGVSVLLSKLPKIEKRIFFSIEKTCSKTVII